MTVATWLLNLSLSRHRRCWREGYDAEHRGQSERSCIYPIGSARTAWMKGFAQSRRDREAASE